MYICIFPQITGTGGPVGSSNIQEHLLPFDLSIFKSLHQIQVNSEKKSLLCGVLTRTCSHVYSKSFAFLWIDWHLESYSGTDVSVQKVMLRNICLKKIVGLPKSTKVTISNLYKISQNLTKRIQNWGT